MAWQNLELPSPSIDIQPLLDLIDKLKEYLNTLVNALELILEAAAAFVDPLTTLLLQIIEKIKAEIEGFLEDLGGYAIFIPIRKKLQTNFLGLGDLTPEDGNPVSLLFAQQPFDIVRATETKEETAARAKFISDANRYSGGNVGFFRTVVDSLFDEGDIARPQFWNEDDYVGGFVIVFGTSIDPLGLLDDIWKLLGFFKNVYAGSGSIKTPRPENLKARVVEGIQGSLFSTLLTWDGLDVPVYTLPDLAGIVLIPSRFVVIRSKNNTDALLSDTVVDMMGTRDLKTGDTFNNGDTVVVYEGEYDLTQNSYLDEDIETGKDDVFYYAVAWKLRAFYQGSIYDRGAGSEELNLDYDTISNVVRVVPYLAVPDSTPPNWYRTPALEDILPDFASMLRKIVAILEGLTARLTGLLDVWKEYIQFLKNEILRYEAMINYILDELKRMLEKFNFSFKTGIYIRGFVGKGGNYFLMNDLVQSLSPSYPNSPPFHRGDEYVAGFILMQGGPQLLVDSFVKSLSWLFGNVDTLKTAQQNFMLTQVGMDLTAAEDALFNEEMEEVDVVVSSQTVPEASSDTSTVNKVQTEQRQVNFSTNMEVK